MKSLDLQASTPVVSNVFRTPPPVIEASSRDQQEVTTRSPPEPTDHGPSITGHLGGLGAPLTPVRAR